MTWNNIKPSLRSQTKVPQVSIYRGFYGTPEWLRLRYDALVKAKGRCECCMNRPTEASPLHVDHIKPRSKHPELALDPSNLQVLCADCNFGKGNRDSIDWRIS